MADVEQGPIVVGSHKGIDIRFATDSGNFVADTPRSRGPRVSETFEGIKAAIDRDMRADRIVLNIPATLISVADRWTGRSPQAIDIVIAGKHGRTRAILAKRADNGKAIDIGDGGQYATGSFVARPMSPAQVAEFVKVREAYLTASAALDKAFEAHRYRDGRDGLGSIIDRAIEAAVAEGGDRG